MVINEQSRRIPRHHCSVSLRTIYCFSFHGWVSIPPSFRRITRSSRGGLQKYISTLALCTALASINSCHSKFLGSLVDALCRTAIIDRSSDPLTALSSDRLSKLRALPTLIILDFNNKVLDGCTRVPATTTASNGLSTPRETLQVRVNTGE